jgi:hypothetical protein
MKFCGLTSIVALLALTLSIHVTRALAEDIFYCSLTDTQYFSVLQCTDACKANCQLEEGDNGFYLCYEKAKNFLAAKCQCTSGKAKFKACIIPKFNRLRDALKPMEHLLLNGQPLVEPGSAQQLRSWVKDQVAACD